MLKKLKREHREAVLKAEDDEAAAAAGVGGAALLPVPVSKPGPPEMLGDVASAGGRDGVEGMGGPEDSRPASALALAHDPLAVKKVTMAGERQRRKGTKAAFLRRSLASADEQRSKLSKVA